MILLWVVALDCPLVSQEDESVGTRARFGRSADAVPRFGPVTKSGRDDLRILFQTATKGHSAWARGVFCRKPKPFGFLRPVVALPIHSFDMNI